MAWHFDEAGGHVTVADNAALTLPDGDFTLGGFVKFDDNVGSNFQYLLSHGTAGAANSCNINITEASSGTPQGPNFIACSIFDASSDNTNLTEFDGVVFPDPGKWHHLCFQRTSDNFVKYWDGDILDVYANGGTGGNVDSINPTGSMYIGGRNDLDADRFLGGSMCEWFLTTNDLTAQDIKNLAEGFSPLYWEQFGNLAWYLPMIAGDYSEYVNGLTVTNVGSTAADHPYSVHYPVTPVKPVRSVRHDLIQAQLDGATVRCTYFVTMDLRSRFMRLWPGFGTRVIEQPGVGPQEWTGIGNLGKLTAIRSSQRQAISEVVASLAIDADLLEAFAADRDETKGRELRIYRQFFDVRRFDGQGNFVEWQTIGPLEHVFRGIMGPPKLEFEMTPLSETPVQMVSVSALDPLENTRRPAFGSWTDRDQQARAPGDNICVMMSRVNRVLKWPVFS